MDEYLGLDNAEYLLRNEINAVIPAWLNASHKSHDGTWLKRSA